MALAVADEVEVALQVELRRPQFDQAAAPEDAESARATALIADQKRLLGDAGEKTAKQAAAAIELKSRIRMRDGASLATSSRAVRGVSAQNP